MIIIRLTSPLPDMKLPIKWPVVEKILANTATRTLCPPVEKGRRDRSPDSGAEERCASVIS